jgi:hypothetical protein
MMTVDQMIERIEQIDRVVGRDANTQWWQEGLTLTHGQQNGSDSWKAHATKFAHAAMGSTIEEAVANLLVVMENALDAFALQTERNAEFIREIKRGKEK